MSNRIKLLSVFILGFLVLAAFAVPMVVNAALAVSGVSPNLVVNHLTTTITISGSDFTNASIVRLDTSALTTTYVSPSTLTAVVPAGFAPDVYDVQVEVPGVGSATLPGGLTILAPTATPSQPYARPQIVIDSYDFSTDAISFGQEFNLNVVLDNAGGSTAYSMQIAFTSTELLMLKNGGVTAVGSLGTVGKAELSQTMTAAVSLSGLTRVSLDMNVTYYDAVGASFTDKFTIYIPVAAKVVSGGTGILPTATPTGVNRSQLVITDYKTDIDPLQPGLTFKLSLTVQNVGTLGAKSVTMVVGGGSTGGSGTPQAGINAGFGEFTTFAPVGTSNVKSLGNIDALDSKIATQDLIVNVSAAPGAYPMKISFLYTDAKGNAVNDEQVITLLVYNLPHVEIGYYQPVQPFFAGQPGLLPIQVVNLGRNFVVLGTMKVETSGGMIENGSMLIGTLEMGGYFPLDATFTPYLAGTYEVMVSISYTDDFSQARTVSQVLVVDVLEGFSEPTPDPNQPIEPFPPASSETFWQKAWRFILGLLGLDSGVSTPQIDNMQPTFETKPAEPVPAEPVPAGKG